MNIITGYLVTLTVCGLLSGCSQAPSGELTKGRAQEAITEWLISSGLPVVVRSTIVVPGVLESPKDNSATAEAVFTDIDGTTMTAHATFIHYNDGQWILRRLEMGRDVVDNLSFAVPAAFSVPILTRVKEHLGLVPTPQRIVQEFMMAVNNGQPARVAELTAPGFLAKLQKPSLESVVLQQSQALRASGGIKSIEVEREVIDGVNAHVFVKAIRGEKEERDQFVLTRDIAGWKVAGMSW